MKMEFTCVSCGKPVAMEVDESSYRSWQNGTLIQKAFPESDEFFREALISRMCYDCIEHTFHKPQPGHEEAWGKVIGECDTCGCPIYECDVKDGTAVCPTCKSEINI